MPTGIGTAIAGGAAAGIAGSLFGGGGSVSSRPASNEIIQQQIGNLPNISIPSIEVPEIGEYFAPLSVSSPSYSFSGGEGDFSFNRTNPSGALNLFDQRLPGYFNSIDTLRSRFPVGFSEIRDARMSAVDAARQRGLSNLRDSLARRRVQGSNFARAEEIQAQREFAQEEANQMGRSFLEEVAVNTELLQAEVQGFQQATNRVMIDLEEFKSALSAAGLSAQVGTARASDKVKAGIAEAGFDVESQIANLNAVSSIIQNLNSITAANAQTQAQISAQNASGVGNLIGLLLTQGGGATTSSGGGSSAPPLIRQNPITSGNLLWTN